MYPNPAEPEGVYPWWAGTLANVKTLGTKILVSTVRALPHG